MSVVDEEMRKAGVDNCHSQLWKLKILTRRLKANTLLKT